MSKKLTKVLHGVAAGVMMGVAAGCANPTVDPVVEKPKVEQVKETEQELPNGPIPDTSVEEKVPDFPCYDPAPVKPKEPDVPYAPLPDFPDREML